MIPLPLPMRAARRNGDRFASRSNRRLETARGPRASDKPRVPGALPPPRASHEVLQALSHESEASFECHSQTPSTGLLSAFQAGLPRDPIRSASVRPRPPFAHGPCAPIRVTGPVTGPGNRLERADAGAWATVAADVDLALARGQRMDSMWLGFERLAPGALACDGTWGCATAPLHAPTDPASLHPGYPFHSASDPLREGTARVVNRSNRAGEASIHPVDDTGRRFDPLTLAIDRVQSAPAAIRADGVFAHHTIYVEFPDGSTSQATAVLAGYATHLEWANPKCNAARLKRELFNLSRMETIPHPSGAMDAKATRLTEPRTVRAIRPHFAPTTWIGTRRFNRRVSPLEFLLSSVPGGGLFKNPIAKSPNLRP